MSQPVVPCRFAEIIQGTGETSQRARVVFYVGFVLDPLFDRDPQTIEHPDCEGPPLTDEMVRAAERELGIQLPPSYIRLLGVCNGGYTRNAVLPTSVPTAWAPDHVPVDVIFGIPAVGERGPFDTGVGILATRYLTTEWGLPDDLVLLGGDGHWWIGLDYRSCGPSGPAPVVWIDLERDEDVRLADNFESFLARLVPAIDDAQLDAAQEQLGRGLPAEIRALYRAGDGRYRPDGRWWVVWPLERMMRENIDAWRDRGLPTSLLAIGDDGTGNPFCVRVGDGAVVRWSWIDSDAEPTLGSVDDFLAEWVT